MQCLVVLARPGTRSAALAVCLAVAAIGPALSETSSPFSGLAGRWVGEGRLGVKDGKNEAVKCRATYFVSEQGDELKQTIRCASAAGNIEVLSDVKHGSDTLTGTWRETVHNIEGELNGEVTDKGFRVAVRADDLTATWILL
jgi:hypothetical protein